MTKRVKCISTKVPGSGNSYSGIWIGEIYEVVNEYENSYYICPYSDFCFEYEKILFEVVESEESEITSEVSTGLRCEVKEQFLIEYVMKHQDSKSYSYLDVVEQANQIWKKIQEFCKE